MNQSNHSECARGSKTLDTVVREIRDPLSKINLAAETLRTLVHREEHKQFLDIILRGSSEISSSVNSLLSYTSQNVFQ